MPTNDIIDNRKNKLVDHINRILGTTEAARFAVGYFFLSGLESIAEKLSSVKELRLLIGNTTNRETLEQIAEGYHRLELVSEAAEAEQYPKRTETKKITAETAEGVRTGMELMDQTDEGENLVRTLAQMIEEKKLKVRVYTKGRLHAKAYIFDYGKVYDQKGKPLDRAENGIAIVGSSNLTLSGVSHNTELNVVVQGNANHEGLVKWFEELWDEAQEFDEALMEELKQSWAIAPVRPYDVYMKTLYSLVKDRLDDDDEKEVLWDDEIVKKLADFQKGALKVAIQYIRDYGGAFVSDVVGLGKSFIGAAIVKHFERTDHLRPLIICPAALIDMWEMYNEVYQLNARVLSMGMLKEDGKGVNNFLLNDAKYKDRNFVLIDESHNLRYPETQRYKVVQAFLATGRRCCFLTATPRNKSAMDVYNQIKLFHQDDKTDLPIDPPNLKEYFRLIEKGEKKLPDLLVNILVRRTRNQILRWYGRDSKTHERIDHSKLKEYQDGRKRAYVLVGGRHQYFPKRELETIDYSIEDTYQGLYREIRDYLGKPRKSQPSKLPENELTYARYGLWHYVAKDKQKKEPYVSLHRAGFNLRGLIRVLLFKRFESSVYAFRETVKRLLTMHGRFVAALDEGVVPAGEDAHQILYDPNAEEEQAFLDAIKKASGRYRIEDFDADRLKEHIKHDVALLKKILKLVDPITPDKDAKLQTLIENLKKKPLKDGKKLIFTQYSDTARYLFENLNPKGKNKDIEVIASGDKSKTRIVGCFAPKANPEYLRANDDCELNMVIATDVLAEGLNLQDCDKIINYDLHWNPVRLIQRFGRIDRIGSEHERIYAFNFLPETGIEKNLGLREILHNRIQEIHDTIGEDSAILDTSETLNETAMYAIYDKDGDQMELFADSSEEFMDLNEAEELLKQLRRENQEEYERIRNLRDGVRAMKPSDSAGGFVFCQAGNFQQLFLLDETGEIVSRDVPKVLGTIKCAPETKGSPTLPGHNKMVMKVKSLFSEEVKHRQAERDHTLSLTHGQNYALRELRILFGNTEDEDTKAQINLLEKAFRGPINPAIKRELTLIRRNGVVGEALLKKMTDLYHQHNMKDWLDRQKIKGKSTAIPKVICSEGFTKNR